MPLETPEELHELLFIRESLTHLQKEIWELWTILDNLAHNSYNYKSNCPPSDKRVTPDKMSGGSTVHEPAIFYNQFNKPNVPISESSTPIFSEQFSSVQNDYSLRKYFKSIEHPPQFSQFTDNSLDSKHLLPDGPLDLSTSDSKHITSNTTSRCSLASNTCDIVNGSFSIIHKLDSEDSCNKPKINELDNTEVVHEGDSAIDSPVLCRPSIRRVVKRGENILKLKEREKECFVVKSEDVGNIKDKIGSLHNVYNKALQSKVECLDRLPSNLSFVSTLEDNLSRDIVPFELHDNLSHEHTDRLVSQPDNNNLSHIKRESSLHTNITSDKVPDTFLALDRVLKTSIIEEINVSCSDQASFNTIADLDVDCCHIQKNMSNNIIDYENSSCSSYKSQIETEDYVDYNKAPTETLTDNRLCPDDSSVDFAVHDIARELASDINNYKPKLQSGSVPVFQTEGLDMSWPNLLTQLSTVRYEVMSNSEREEIKDSFRNNDKKQSFDESSSDNNKQSEKEHVLLPLSDIQYQYISYQWGRNSKQSGYGVVRLRTGAYVNPKKHSQNVELFGSVPAIAQAKMMINEIISEECPVTKIQAAIVIGQGSENHRNICDKTGTAILVEGDIGDQTVQIIGIPNDIFVARVLVSKLLKGTQNKDTVLIVSDNEVGRILRADGSFKRYVSQSYDVLFRISGKKGDDRRELSLKGDKKKVSTALEIIRNTVYFPITGDCGDGNVRASILADEDKSVPTSSATPRQQLVIPVSDIHAAQVIGWKGAMVNKISQEAGVKISISGLRGRQSRKMEIIGSPRQIDKALEIIKSLKIE